MSRSPASQPVSIPSPQPRLSHLMMNDPQAKSLSSVSGAGGASADRCPPPSGGGDDTIRVRASAIIHADAEYLYLLWRDVESAPIWQEQILSVTAKSASRSHWVMKSGATIIEWDVEILADEPGRRIAWASVAGDSHNSGEVFFEETADGSGTQVTVFQEFHMGTLAGAWKSIAGCDPTQAVMENLRDFKALVETCEIPRSDHHTHHLRPGSDSTL